MLFEVNDLAADRAALISQPIDRRRRDLLRPDQPAGGTELAWQVARPVWGQPVGPLAGRLVFGEHPVDAGTAGVGVRLAAGC